VATTRDAHPLVSVVTPSLNQGRFIEEAITSVRDQSYPNIEHIVVDGGSTDETLNVLRRHPHVRWISEPDDGQADAVNKGFALAQGDIFGWLNADDFYLAGAVATAVRVLLETGCGMVHGGWRQVDEDGNVVADVAVVPFDLRAQLEERNAVAQPSTFFTREAFESVGGLDTTYRYAMDYELWLKLGARVGVRHVDDVLGAYRYHGSSKSVAEYGDFWPETHRASRAHGGRYFSPMYRRAFLERHPWAARAELAARLLHRGELRELRSRAGARLGRRRRAG
jgi:glycosyltransferase involved in cell wall biosynthesis